MTIVIRLVVVDNNAVLALLPLLLLVMVNHVLQLKNIVTAIPVVVQLIVLSVTGVHGELVTRAVAEVVKLELVLSLLLHLVAAIVITIQSNIVLATLSIALAALPDSGRIMLISGEILLLRDLMQHSALIISPMAI